MPGKQAKVVTPPMLKRMLRRVSHSSFPARDRAMILLSIKAGLRACEIAGLDWSMVLDAQGRVRHDPRPRRHREEAWRTADSHAPRPAARVGATGAHHGADRAGDPLLSRRALEGEQHRELHRVADLPAKGRDRPLALTGRRRRPRCRPSRRPRRLTADERRQDPHLRNMHPPMHCGGAPRA